MSKEIQCKMCEGRGEFLLPGYTIPYVCDECQGTGLKSISEIKSELADKYYSEDANVLSDFHDILDEYEKLIFARHNYIKTSK